ncbi:hypothetical protein H8356DRAFT_1327675 [Neocallimastix lanati (nom. inval.)]|nr:hypothetical protein H8356DRAFT_1327675 [Neocallimastix sp. JGI-2020a]
MHIIKIIYIISDFGNTLPLLIVYILISLLKHASSFSGYKYYITFYKAYKNNLISTHYLSCNYNIKKVRSDQDLRIQ